MSDIKRALQEALLSLNNQCTEPRLEAEILLSHVLTKNRAYLYSHDETLLTPEQLAQYQNLVQQRAQGTPLAYLTGIREFWSMPLKVNPHTLIPRHDTERLVELALELLPKKANLKILDLGTGSGAIALALAKERPHWQIDACDFSLEALDVAKENAKALNLNQVQFYHSDWFSQLPAKQYDAIVSNPPYIAQGDPHLLQGDLRFEPLSALVSSQEGLSDLQYLITHSKQWLRPNGLLLLEHGYDQKNKVCTILIELEYQEVQCWQDIQGHDRISGGWYKPAPSVIITKRD